MTFIDTLDAYERFKIVLDEMDEEALRLFAAQSERSARLFYYIEKLLDLSPGLADMRAAKLELEGKRGA